MMLKVRAARVFAAAALLTIAGGFASAEEEKVLNVYNWSDYVAPDTLEEFTKRTGIKVNYDVYDSNEVLEAKLLVGKSGYDVVFPSAMPYLAREVKGGIYQKLDFSKLPNAKGVDPKVLGQREATRHGEERGRREHAGGANIEHHCGNLTACSPSRRFRPSPR